ncbi:MAG: hypothetical protein IKM24_02340, partial [Clostridia bacterium]|nr:hypothetical protein [Clostridia bacterium]
MKATRMNKRMTAFVSRFVLVLAMLCLVVTALPADGFTVMAATNEAFIGTVTNWQDYISSAQAGDTVNAEMIASFEVTYGTTLTVPEGVTVNLYMNGKTISTSTDAWENVNMNLIDNKGILNIYPGSISNPNSGSSAITANNTRTGMNASHDNESAVSNVVAIKNSNKLTVNTGVNISATAILLYDDADSGNNGLAHTMATGIYNTSNTATCVMNASVNTNAQATGATYNINQTQSAFAYSRCIYGGTVTVNGDAALNASAKTNHATDGGRSDNIYAICEAYCVVSDAQITVNGGTFSSSIAHDNELSSAYTGNVHNQGFCGNVATLGYVNVVPVVTDGDFKIAVNCIAEDKVEDTNEFEIRQYTISYVQDGFLAPQLRGGTTSLDTWRVWRNANAANSGNYLDETGYVHTPGAANSSGGTAVTTVTRGAVAGSGSVVNTRIHVIYRFWQSTGKSYLLDYVVKGTDDAKITNKAELYINGTENKNNITSVGNNNDPQKLTVRMYESANKYYWDMINVAYALGDSKNYNDFTAENFEKAGTREGMVKSFEGVSAAGNSYVEYTYNVTSSAPLYIYVDYYQKPSSDVQAIFGSSNTVEVTYTGNAPVANETPGFAARIIMSGNAGTIWTDDYNLANKEDSSLLDVNYSYVNNNNTDDAGVGLPINAGTYTVSYTLEDDTHIDRNDDVFSKNRKPLSGQFTMRINRAYALRGNLPETLTLQYGETLGDKLPLNGLQATGVNNEAPSGTFMFTNGTADSSAYKDV